MSRTIKSVHRPDPHLFDEDPDVPPDFKDRRFCRCGLVEADGVHVTSEQLVADLPPRPEDDVTARILGEA